MKIVFAVLASLMISGSAMAGSIPSADSDRSTSRDSREWRTGKPVSFGIRVYIGQLRGPMDRVLRAKVGAELEKAGYIVVDDPEPSYEEEQDFEYSSSSDSGLFPTILELAEQAERGSRSYKRENRRRVPVAVDADFTISGYFDTDGLIRNTAQVDRSAGVRISLEGLMALKVEKVGSNRIHTESIRESWSTWIGSVSVGSRGNDSGSFPTIWGGNDSQPAATIAFGSPSYLKAYEEVYSKIAVKVVKELDTFALPRR